MKNLETTYKKKVNKIVKTDSFYYVCINPIEGLKSFEQFKYIIKNCIREVSKHYNKFSSHQYLKYVSVIEVNKSITKGLNLYNGKFPKIKEYNKDKNLMEFVEVKNDIDEMGYHTHIFFEKKVDYWEIDPDIFRDIVFRVFKKEGITIDYLGKDVIPTPKKFINYHTKQFHYLDEGFVLSNLKVNHNLKNGIVNRTYNYSIVP